MASKVLVKRSNVAGKTPTAADLEIGELAINFPDQKVYTKEPGGTVIELGGGSAPVWTVTGSNIAYTAGTVTTGRLAVDSGGTIQVQFGASASENWRVDTAGGLITSRAQNAGFRYTSHEGFRFDAGQGAANYAFVIDNAGGIRFSGLSGTGNEMVVVDASGNLSRQAIPSGGGGGGTAGMWTLTGSDIAPTNAGNVGIGLSGAPARKLSVESSQGVVASFGNSKATASISLFDAATTDDRFVRVQSSGDSIQLVANQAVQYKIEGTVGHEWLVDSGTGFQNAMVLKPDGTLEIVSLATGSDGMVVADATGNLRVEPLPVAGGGGSGVTVTVAATEPAGPNAGDVWIQT